MVPVLEKYAALDSGDSVLAKKPGVVSSVDAKTVIVRNDDGSVSTYPIMKFSRSNPGNCYNQRVVVKEGQRVEYRDVIADGPSTDGGELALGKNLLVAYMPWEGLNYEDAIILSQRMVSEDVLTSIHIEEHEIDARDTKLAPRRSPATSPTSARRPWPTSTSAASSASAPRSPPATSSSVRSPPRARPS